ncbi:unnamed protein product [Symbiodinium sp. CCMP2456]|nr:unnamed protein product [Symbiodinium sp. CCMP2456]
MAVFCLWWQHELPVVLLPLIAAAAKNILDTGNCCHATSTVLKNWWTAWTEGSTADRMDAALAALQTPRSAEDLREVLQASPGECKMLQVLQLSAGQGEPGIPCVDNITLLHQAAHLFYNLYREKKPPSGWQEAGDGVLLWPELDAEFDPDQGQPGRGEYLRACGALLPRFLSVMAEISEAWFQHQRVSWSCIACDCLALPVHLTGRQFDRVFSSNVADHVGVPALALALAPLGGELQVCLSNNLRALDLSGDIKTLFLKVHGITLEAGAAALGFAPHSADQDKVYLKPCEVQTPAALEALRRWPAESARRLYRCPRPDGDTLRRLPGHGNQIRSALHSLAGVRNAHRPLHRAHGCSSARSGCGGVSRSSRSCTQLTHAAGTVSTSVAASKDNAVTGEATLVEACGV